MSFLTFLALSLFLVFLLAFLAPFFSFDFLLTFLAPPFSFDFLVTFLWLLLCFRRYFIFFIGFLLVSSWWGMLPFLGTIGTKSADNLVRWLRRWHRRFPAQSKDFRPAILNVLDISQNCLGKWLFDADVSREKCVNLNRFSLPQSILNGMKGFKRYVIILKQIYTNLSL